MLNDICKLSGLFTAAALLALSIGSAARAGDPCEDRGRIARYYECCYGPNRYAKCMSWNRCEEPCPEPETALTRLRERCYCVRNCCMAPGSRPPCKFVDICLYRAVFPMSPWYSNPRDGIIYPAYGSKSPTCVPQND